MTRKVALFVTATAVALLVLGAPAGAKPIDKGHFDDVFHDAITCGTTPVTIDGNVRVNFVFNKRGSSPFPYYSETAHGTVVATNTKTLGTFTQVFNAMSKDQTIVDNGNGTITITSFASGGSRWYDSDGKLVLRDPGEVRFSIVINYNGTPSNPDDDIEVAGSSMLVRESTGLNETDGRDFCADVLMFTT